jgi:uncharacterized protein (TIGR00730 family)
LTRSICVFCGSSSGDNPRFGDAARDTGRAIASRGWTLVYGGGRVGLMGVLANAALEAGGTVVGVIPRFLYEWEVGHDGLTRLEIVETLTERKQRMGELSGAFLSLPGGIGTLDELFEAWSWAQLGLQPKPSALLNVAGYYDGLVGFLDRATASGFMRPQHRALLTVGSDPGRLLDALNPAAT